MNTITIPRPATARDVVVSVVDLAKAIGSDWEIKAPRTAGQPYVIRIWDAVPKPMTPEEIGQLRLTGNEEQER